MHGEKRRWRVCSFSDLPSGVHWQQVISLASHRTLKHWSVLQRQYAEEGAVCRSLQHPDCVFGISLLTTDCNWCGGIRIKEVHSSSTSRNAFEVKRPHVQSLSKQMNWPSQHLSEGGEQNKSYPFSQNNADGECQSARALCTNETT